MLSKRSLSIPHLQAAMDQAVRDGQRAFEGAASALQNSFKQGQAQSEQAMRGAADQADSMGRQAASALQGKHALLF